MHEGPVLLTGATGYIGSRLLRELEAGGCTVRCLARQPARVAASRATTEVVAGDCLDAASLDAAMAGVDQAVYLVHSMASGAEFAALDRQAALNFGRAARKAGVRRIVYLGGLAADADSLSTHLKSRLETGEVLRDSGVPVVELRASIVIGAGSLSFEMIRALVERLPAMVCPRWVDTPTQPIAIDDVVAYLRAALDLPAGRDGVFEIGGPDVVSYGDMMREYAKLRGLRRALIPVPVLTPRLSGLWLGLVTPAQARVGRALVESLRNPTVVRSSAALETFAIRPRTLHEAFVRAIDEGRAGQIRIDSRAERAVRDTAPRDRGGGRVMVAAALGLVAATALKPAAARAQAPPAVRTVPFVDLDRYAGDWFEIARFPNRFQRQCVGDVRATYGRRSDGRVDVVNRCRTAEGETEARGVARIVDERTFAKLKVRFAPAWLSWLPMVWGDYWIIGLAPDYSWAVVGDPGRDYLWILARAPHLDEASTAAAQAVARNNGFDLTRLVPTSLRAEESPFATGSASAQPAIPDRFSVTVEGLNVWQQRNDVRIPPDTGTEFSLVDLVGSSPTPSVRVTATADVTERQQLQFVYAPLQLSGRGTPAVPIAFAGTTFATAPTEAVYKFSSYRGTWSYRVYQGPTWTWRVGFTGFVRDARIALSQTDRQAEDTDVGFVPLGRVSAAARLSARWSAGFVLDGSAAPQGRAFDFAATLEYRPAPRWSVFGGYRTIEGGADVDTVYTFAWLNAVVGGIGVRF